LAYKLGYRDNVIVVPLRFNDILVSKLFQKLKIVVYAHNLKNVDIYFNYYVNENDV
jgi:hypothetical protein